jgi:branched-chain amino acid transport system substrate-binding protein
MKKNVKNLVVNSLLATLTLSLTACTTPTTTETKTKETVKFGLLAPLTGSFEGIGKGAKNAVDLAVNEINSNGGVLGKDLEVLVADDGSGAKKALEGAKELVGKGVTSIIGPSVSSATIPVANDVTIPANVLLMSYFATSPAVTAIKDNNLVWRTIPSDAFQGVIAARTAFNEYKARKVGVLYVDSAYGKGISQVFKDEFEKLGGTVPNFISYPEKSDSEIESFDYASKVKELFADKPDLIYLVTYFKDGAKITVAAKDYVSDSYKPVVFGCDGNYGDDFRNNADQKFIEGMVGTAPVPPSTDVNYTSFVKNYKEKFKTEPPAFTETAYDAVYLLAYSMLKSGKTDSKSLSENIKIVSSTGESINVNEFKKASEMIQKGTDIDYQGASGKVDMDDNGDVTSGNYVIWKIESGKAKEVKVIPFP